jgi:hypothetical protein
LKTKIAEIELHFWFDEPEVPVVAATYRNLVTFAPVHLFYWKGPMRLWLLVIGLKVLTGFAQRDFDPTPFFACDIHQFPLVFLEFEVEGVPHGQLVKTYSDTSILYSPKAGNRNDKIAEFIRGDEHHGHMLVDKRGLDTLDPEAYPYVFGYKQVKIYSYDSITGTDQRAYATRHLHKFASCFYLENRLTGRFYKPFIDPVSYRGSAAYSENEALPMALPKDSQFFRELKEYITRLTALGPDVVLAQDKERYAPATNRLNENTINQLTIGVAAFAFIAIHVVARTLF